MKFSEIMSKFIDVKTIVSIILTLITAFSWVSSNTQSFLEDLKNELYVSMTDPFYSSLTHDLMKQLEKLNKDPADIKTHDIDKFAQFCDGYFGKTYILTQPDSRALKFACDGMLKLYDENLYVVKGVSK